MVVMTLELGRPEQGGEAGQSVTNNLLKTAWIDSPFGRLLMGEVEGALCLLSLGEKDERPLLTRLLKRLGCAHQQRTPDDLLQYHTVVTALVALAAGKETSRHPAVALIGTAFQRHVWQTLRTIPRGETLTYRALAEKTGRPSSVRAVAQAVAANPIGIFVPCHRVIGSNGDLTGFAGGLALKRRLLTLEGVLSAETA